MQKISIIIPCYKSEKTLPHVVNQVIETIRSREQYSYEIILVNDNSPDDVYDVITQLCSNDLAIKGVNLSRNFGQHAAIMCGMTYVTGELIICLDDDGQTPANELFKLIDKLNQGFDLVYANYENRTESAFRTFGTFVNDKMADILIGKPKGITLTSYFGVKRYVIQEAIKYKNPYPYIGGLLCRITDNVAKVFVQHNERLEGSSGYSIKSLMSLWLNGFTAFSVKPLRIASLIGVIFAFLGFVFGIYSIIKRLLDPTAVLGYATLVSLIVFIGGMIMIMLGLIGEYIGRIYISLNKSPQYVVKESKNIEI